MKTDIYPPLLHNSTFPIRQPSNGYPLGQTGRLLVALWSVCLLAGFVVARNMDPDPRGFGTHEGLGLPPCSFRTVFGVPCPSCGMTTSFAHFTRGEIVNSARANAAGLLLATVCAVQIPWCWLSFLTGRLWRVSQPGAWLLLLLLVLCGASALQWGLRLLI